MATAVGSTIKNGQPGYLMSDGSFKPLYSGGSSSSSGVRGGSTIHPSSLQARGSVPGASTTGTTTRSGGSGGSTQTTSQPSAPSFDDLIDNAFNSTVSFLDKQASNLRGQLPGIESDINSMYGESVNTLAADKQSGLRDIDAAQVGGEQRQEDAITAATRLYNELTMGGRQRFGGASSAGEAYQSLAGRELQRNNQQIATDFSNFMGQVEGARTKLNEQYTLSLQNLEGQKNRMLSEARRDLQNKLMQIEGQKAMAQAEKANRKLEALQAMRNQVYQINLAMADETKRVNEIKNSLESEIQTYAQSQLGALSGVQNANQAFAPDMNPETAMAFGGGGQAIASLPTGVRRDDDLNPMGSIYNSRQRMDNFFG